MGPTAAVCRSVHGCQDGFTEHVTYGDLGGLITGPGTCWVREDFGVLYILWILLLFSQLSIPSIVFPRTGLRSAFSIFALLRITRWSLDVGISISLHINIYLDLINIIPVTHYLINGIHIPAYLGKWSVDGVVTPTSRICNSMCMHLRFPSRHQAPAPDQD